MGFTEVARPDSPLLRDAPIPGDFCIESKFDDSRANLMIGLYVCRVLALESDVSNSVVNYFK